jgi:hypothetical protein
MGDQPKKAYVVTLRPLRFLAWGDDEREANDEAVGYAIELLRDGVCPWDVAEVTAENARPHEDIDCGAGPLISVEQYLRGDHILPPPPATLAEFLDWYVHPAHDRHRAARGSLDGYRYATDGHALLLVEDAAARFDPIPMRTEAPDPKGVSKKVAALLARESTWVSDLAAPPVVDPDNVHGSWTRFGERDGVDIANVLLRKWTTHITAWPVRASGVDGAGEAVRLDGDGWMVFLMPLKPGSV